MACLRQEILEVSRMFVNALQNCNIWYIAMKLLSDYILKIAVCPYYQLHNQTRVALLSTTSISNSSQVLLTRAFLRQLYLQKTDKISIAITISLPQL
jgi:hypothetical protein